MENCKEGLEGRALESLPPAQHKFLLRNGGTRGQCIEGNDDTLGSCPSRKRPGFPNLRFPGTLNVRDLISIVVQAHNQQAG